MTTRKRALAGLVAACAVATAVGPAGAAKERSIALTSAGVYETGIYDGTAAEIAAFDPKSRRLFVTNSADGTLDVLDASNPLAPSKLFAIDLSSYGGDPTSVAVNKGLVAVAVVAVPKTDPGSVAFFNAEGEALGAVTVGALPDMVIFTPNGRHLLVANEGEPNDAYTVDPHGTVAIVDVDKNNPSTSEVALAGFDAFPRALLDPSVRIFGPGASVAQDLEPEYITVSHDSRTAWVTLQEGNAIAELDLKRGAFVVVRGLGFKDHSLPGSALDASDRDGPGSTPKVNLQQWPVLGMYQPDAIVSYNVRGETYLVTANEGDVRDYPGFAEATRVGSSSYQLDPVRFPSAAQLKTNAQLGRLNVTRATGDTDGDGDFDAIYAFGARSFSIRAADGTLLWDSGDALERLNTADTQFNSSNSANNSGDSRSDDKGPEPEGVAIGKVKDRWYAFVGLERIGGVAVYDVTEPTAPTFVQYVNTRDFAGVAAVGTAGDLGPEGIAFVDANDSPTDSPLLVVTNEISGSTRLFAIAQTP